LRPPPPPAPPPAQPPAPLVPPPPPRLIHPSDPRGFLRSVGVPDDQIDALLTAFPDNPLQAALEYSRQDPHGSVLIIVGTERPKGDHRLLVQADPADANNSRFDAFAFFRGGFSLSEEKTLYRLRELFYADHGAAYVLPMLRRCDDEGLYSILNVVSHNSSRCVAEPAPTCKVLRTIADCVETSFTLVMSISAPASNLGKAVLKSGKPLVPL